MKKTKERHDKQLVRESSHHLPQHDTAEVVSLQDENVVVDVVLDVVVDANEHNSKRELKELKLRRIRELKVIQDVLRRRDLQHAEELGRHVVELEGLYCRSQHSKKFQQQSRQEDQYDDDDAAADNNSNKLLQQENGNNLRERERERDSMRIMMEERDEEIRVLEENLCKHDSRIKIFQVECARRDEQVQVMEENLRQRDNRIELLIEDGDSSIESLEEESIDAILPSVRKLILNEQQSRRKKCE
jgi:hypothetical protein